MASAQRRRKWAWGRFDESVSAVTNSVKFYSNIGFYYFFSATKSNDFVHHGTLECNPKLSDTDLSAVFVEKNCPKSMIEICPKLNFMKSIPGSVGWPPGSPHRGTGSLKLPKPGDGIITLDLSGLT
jgi:hypothetical protein